MEGHLLVPKELPGASDGLLGNVDAHDIFGAPLREQEAAEAFTASSVENSPSLAFASEKLISAKVFGRVNRVIPAVLALERQPLIHHDQVLSGCGMDIVPLMLRANIFEFLVSDRLEILFPDFLVGRPFARELSTEQA